MRPRRSTPLDIVELYDYAVSALGRRMRSVAELKRLLRQKVAGQHDAELLTEAVILKLKDQKYLNDTAYAQAYSTFRRENEKFGRQRVASDLRARGVHGDIIAKTVGETYADVNEEQLARDYLRRKRMREPADQKQAARIFRALMRAGFASRTIFAVLKKWNVDDDTLTVLESEVAESDTAGRDDDDR